MKNQHHELTSSEWNSFIQKEIFPQIESKNLACVLGLVGDLGAGKTTFSKELLLELGVKDNITSPTFSIINSYPISYQNFTHVFHVDVYRIEDIQELEVLRFDTLLNNPHHIVVIEWADMIKDILPNTTIWIQIEHNNHQSRNVTVVTQ